MTNNHEDHHQSLMPVLFIGHGTPMNAIEDNEFTRAWKGLASQLPRPKAVLCISAHWEADSSLVGAMKNPKTIHDFGGFPKELYEQQYPAPGTPEFADMIQAEINGFAVEKDYEWGLDHGAWCFLKHIYPNADIPVFQLSIDYTKDMQSHYDLGQELAFLRKQGVLIAGSGNMVHNLMLACPGENGFNTEFGYDWAVEMNGILKEKILSGDHNALIDYRNLSKNARLGVPTEEHYIPLIYSLALQNADDNIEIFNDKLVAGSLSMTSLIISNSINNKTTN